MNYINKREFEVNNIPTWHEKGYTGKGVRVANMETCNLNPWYLKGRINDPFDNGKKALGNSHGNQTMNMLIQVAPDAEFYTLPRGGVYKKDSVTGKLIDESLPFMVSEKIHLVNASVGGTNNEILNNAIEYVKSCGTTFVCSAGNSGDRGVSPYAQSGVWIAVGAVALTDRGDINLTSYSSMGEEVDFVQFSEVYIHDIVNKNRLIHLGGTSFSSPLLTGMLALVQQFFIEKTGKVLNQEQLYQFMVDNSVDLGEVGKDIEYGYGLFVLPAPEDIDVNKYVKKEVEDQTMKPNKIIIHHSATEDTPAQNFNGIRTHHISVNGWADIGYHYVVENVGGKYVTIAGRAENVAGVHCPGQNSQSLGVCLVGDFRKGPPPQGQLEEAARLIKDIYSRHGELPLHGHSEFVSTACPCFDLDLLRELLKEVSWQEKQGLEHLDSLVKKEIIDSPDYWRDKMLEPMPTWAFFSLIDRITKEK